MRLCLELEAALCERVLTKSVDAKRGLAALNSAKAGLWDNNFQLLDSKGTHVGPEELGTSDGEFKEGTMWKHTTVDDIGCEVLKPFLEVT